jgi:hypothetical protein
MMVICRASRPRRVALLYALLAALAASGCHADAPTAEPASAGGSDAAARPGQAARYEPRTKLDASGFFLIAGSVAPWPPDASLQEVSIAWNHPGWRMLLSIDRLLSQPGLSLYDRIEPSLTRAMCLNFEGEAEEAYEALAELRNLLAKDRSSAQRWLYSVIYFQGVTALRRGENDNCILCRGETSCIIPIAPQAVHTNPAGSRLAIGHFTEYLDRFPDDLEVRWLLNLAHMTLDEHPGGVDPRFLIPLEPLQHSEQDIGRFRDIGHLVGVNRFNQSGGAIMDDFDNDGLLDIAVTSMDPAQSMALFRNRGDGRFSEVTAPAGIAGQLGGLYCVQTDFNNDGFLDIYIPRGAWIQAAIRPTLLRNEGDGTWSDVTREAGLLVPVNSNSASWADYDNDGNLDLYVCCERQANCLFHNRGDGGFDEVAEAAGVVGSRKPFCKGAAWFDCDNDGAVDLFLNYFGGEALLFHNERDGRFFDVTQALGIDGPQRGFPCWAWDYDNDGWLDLFATSYDFTLEGVVQGLTGEPHHLHSGKLWRNAEGRWFEDRTAEAGLDQVFATMGSNFADFDNDGWLDMYLGTGSPDLAMLVPNRMFRNDGGRRFVEITGSSRTGHLQKGHAVACGDWDRDGNIDLFIEMGGPTYGDRYHNVLFQNPGHDNHWLTVKLIGRKSNRAALGVRLSLTTGGAEPRTVYRHVSSGSSFGANTLEQTIGLGGADRIDRLEILWPASEQRQTLLNVPVDRCVTVVEGVEGWQVLRHEPIALPASDD